MNPLGEKLVELMKKDRDFKEKYKIAPNIPQEKINNLKNAVNCPAQDEVYALLDATIFGSAKDGTLYAESGYYWKIFSHIEHYTYEELFRMFNEGHNFFNFEDRIHCNIGPDGVDKKGKTEYQVELIGKFWQEFFDFYAQYSGSAEAAATPVANGMKVCEYCGKKFDAALDNCPGCGAPA